MLKVVQDAEASNENTASSSLLDEIVRNGARQMLATALQAEVIAYGEAFADEVDEHGRRLVVRNGQGLFHKSSKPVVDEGDVYGRGVADGECRSGSRLAWAARRWSYSGPYGSGRMLSHLVGGRILSDLDGHKVRLRLSL